MRDQLRPLSREVLLAQEEERKRISRELHTRQTKQRLRRINHRILSLALVLAHFQGLGLFDPLPQPELIEERVDRQLPAMGARLLGRTKLNLKAGLFFGVVFCHRIFLMY
jgi:hypothetical protein